MSIRLKDTITDSIDKLDGQHSSYFAHTIKIGTSTTEYNSTNSIISLPAYPTIPTIPTTLPNPTSLTIQANGTSLGTYNGSSELTVNLTYSDVGAAKADHSHTQYLNTTTTRTKNTILAGPGSGSDAAPTFRALVAADIPSLAISKITNLQTTLDSKANSSSLSNYLPLSGGTITGTLQIKRTGSAIQYLNESGTVWGWMGYDSENTATVWNSNGSTKYTILHTGNWSNIIAAKNHSHDYLPLSGGIITSNDVGLTIKRTTTYPIISYYGGNASTQSFYGALGFSGSNSPCYVDNTGNNVYTLIHSNNIGSYNAGSSTKLATARTIWGQSFNGEANVDGTLHLKATGNSYTQGIRIYQNSTSYAGILLGSKDLTASTGSDSNSWFICTDAFSNFSISKGGYLPTDETSFGWDADKSKWRINGATIIDINTESSDSSSISLNSSSSCLKLFAWSDGSTYIESGNKNFSANAQLNVTGINGGQGSTLWLNFSTISCGASKYTNIHSGNIGSYVSSTSIPENLSVSNLGIKNTASNGTSGISLYAGCDFVQSYGILFTGTSTYGGQFGDVLTGDWATYFTMDGGATTQGANVRGWIFRHKTGGNKVSIGADGNIQCTAWYRTIGNGGWYNETHGGGWFQDNSYWIKSYGSKPIQVNVGSGNTWAAGGHRCAADFYGQDHIAIQLRNNICSWSVCSNGNRNLYFGYRNNSSDSNTSGDTYPMHITPDGTLYLNGQAITFTT